MVISSLQCVGAQILSAALILTGATTALSASEAPIEFPKEYVTTGPSGFGVPANTPASPVQAATIEKLRAYVEGRTIDVATPATREVEKPQALLGQLYTVVTPVFYGADGHGGNFSYLRFAHLETTASSVRISVVGSPSARVYGTATLTLPPLSSPQYPVEDIFKAASAESGPTNGDESLSLYIQKTDSTDIWGFQHVIYNDNNLFFENSGLCTWTSDLDYSLVNAVLPHVHTSLVAGYPSRIVVHNYYATSLTFKIVLADPETGTIVGSKDFTLAPNSTAFTPFSFYEEQFGLNVAAQQLYKVNMFFLAVSTSGFYLLPGHFMQNLSNPTYGGTLLNMSQFCAVNR